MNIPQVSILTVGSELLTGKTLDTNARFLAQELCGMGLRVRSKISVHDEATEIVEALDLLFQVSELVIVSGGLGPTLDDITKQVLSGYFGTRLELNRRELRKIQKLHPDQVRTVPEFVRRQASYPQNVHLLKNPVGAAQGLVFRRQGKYCIAIPGVPREAEGMFRQAVQPFLKKTYPALRAPQTAVFKTIGQNESFLLKRIGRLGASRGTRLGIYPEIGEVTLRIQNIGLSREQFSRIKTLVQKRIQPWLYAKEETKLSEVLVRELTKRGKTVAIAESCTGGWISKKITDIPGSSRVLRGGVVAYSDRVKEELLKVPGKVLSAKGAVSRETALVMAQQVRQLLGSDYGLSATGISGPSGGSVRKPVGLTYIGISTERGSRTYEFMFKGDRAGNRLRTVQKALQILKDELWGTRTVD